MIEEIQSILKIMLSIALIYNLGIPLGIIISYIMFMNYRILIKKIFGLEMLLNLDKCFVGFDPRERINIICLLTFENFDPLKIKNMIIERAIKKINKLRQQIVYWFGNYYWKEVSIEEAIKRIEIVEDSENDAIKDESDLIKYANKQINIHINLLKDLPYEIKILSYQQNGATKGAILWKIDHCLTDGLGILSAVCAIADNYDENVFPPIMKNYKFKFYSQILDWVQFIYYGPMVIYQMFSKDTCSSPFREGQRSSGISKCLIGKTYELDEISKIRRKLNLSFNDLMMCILSRTFHRLINKKIYKNKFQNLKYFKVLIPVGRKEVPKNINDVNLSNQANSLFLPIPVIDDLIKDSKLISNSVNKSLKNVGFMKAGVIFANIAMEYLPTSVLLNLADSFSENIDMTVSNVPGPNIPLYYSGYKVEKMIPFVSTNRTKSFFPISTYNKIFRTVISTDNTCEISDQEFLELFDDEIQKLFKFINN